MTATDRRLAARHSLAALGQAVQVDLHSRDVPVHAVAMDVSRHGLFIACNEPLTTGHAILLTVHLAGGPFEMMATVVRTSVVRSDGVVGSGLKIFCLGAGAKTRWDRYVASLDGGGVALPTRQVSAHSACFLVQLATPEALLDFVQRTLLSRRPLHVTPAVREKGATVLFVLVHPITHAELEVSATVTDFNPDHPMRMEVRFDIEQKDLERFKAFLGPITRKDGDRMESGAPHLMLEVERASWSEYTLLSPRLEPELAVVKGELLTDPRVAPHEKEALFDFNWTSDTSTPQ